MFVRCTHCGLDLEAPPGGLGRRLRCPGCGGTFICRLPRATFADDLTAEPVDDALVLDDELPDRPPGPVQAPEAPEAPPEEVGEAPAAVAEALAELDQSRPEPVVKESPRQWHVVIEGVPAVALTYPELVSRAAAGKIKARTKIYYAPKQLTVSARDIPGLFPAEDAKRAEADRRAGRAPRPAPAQDVAGESAAALTRMEQQEPPPSDAEALGHLGEQAEADREEGEQAG